MDDDGQLRLSRHLQLANENLLLHLAGRVVIVKVQPNFADGQDFGLACRGPQQVKVPFFGFLGLVRMNADRGINPVVTFGDGKRNAKIVARSLPRWSEDSAARQPEPARLPRRGRRRNRSR